MTFPGIRKIKQKKLLPVFLPVEAISSSGQFRVLA